MAFLHPIHAFPIGGVKNSGYGRELSYFGLREFSNAQIDPRPLPDKEHSDWQVRLFGDADDDFPCLGARHHMLIGGNRFGKREHPINHRLEFTAL